ncbi:MAG TPA: c-type cytochrome, partial [Gemmatimonadaceae bacterium]|nr:c-type cytochrome [Gemmatimonadaceae bacterium]
PSAAERTHENEFDEGPRRIRGAVYRNRRRGGLLHPTRSPQASAKEDPAKRGAYLVSMAGCHDCHSPKLFTAAGPVPDTTRLLSGHPASDKLPDIPRNVVGPGKWGALTSGDFTAWVGPWGVSFTANLTPDVTGLGAWNDSIFIQTIRNGKHMGTGRDILPPMPWPVYAHMTDDDLRAVFAYLRTLKPIQNVVLAPVPPKG